MKGRDKRRRAKQKREQEQKQPLCRICELTPVETVGKACAICLEIKVDVQEEQCSTS